jgi:oligopeptidase B
MTRAPSPLALLLVGLAAACGGPGRGAPGLDAEPVPPVAVRRPHDVVAPHGTRSDPYYWLRDDTRQDADVLAYLRAENAYTAAALAPVKGLEDTLFAEMRARIKEDDATVPVFDEGYWYYERFETGKQQPIHARRKGTLDAPEEVLLDGNRLAEGHAFYKIGDYAVSRGGTLLAWTDDTVGRNQFVLHVKDLATGTLRPETATNVAPAVAWANDDHTLFYVGKDAVTLREDRVFRQALGGAPELVFQEADGAYYVDVEPTKSHRYIQITLEATTNTEVRLLDADRPTAPPRVAIPRGKDHLYDLDHLDGRFVIRTNADAANFRLVMVDDGKEADRAAWRDVIPHRAQALVEDFALYRGFIAATVRTGGLRKVQIVAPRTPPSFLDASEPTYAMAVVDTPDPAAMRVRYVYESMVAPETTYELDLTTGQRHLLHVKPVPGYDPTKYASEYLHATARDGTRIPISVVYAKTTPRDGTAPLLIYGYGSYGVSSDAELELPVISMLDRGWVHAIAHVRGGQELGRAWYEAGKLAHKMNTFTDFIAVTEHLVAERYAAPDQVFASGWSAGGLLIGAIVNLRPDLYRGVIAGVPFVDVVTTMLDESIPLTTNEFDEWGNPKDKAAYDWMLAYSPYDNVAATGYPSIFVQSGLWDSQVQYFEPTKWVARLRATRTDRNLIVLDTDMTAGHAGASGRFDRLRQTARQLAFLLHVSARPDTRPVRAK